MFDVAALESLAQLKKPRYLRRHQVYSRLYYNTRIKTVFEREKALKPNLKQHELMKLRSSLIEDLYKQESDACRAEVEKERETLYQSQTKTWEEQMEALKSVESAKAYV